jgi:hypothetical protein
MTTITFDTQDAVIKLKAVGVSQDQADAFIRAIADAQNNLITKTDLEIALANLKVDLIKWIAGLLLAQGAVIGALVKLL